LNNLNKEISNLSIANENQQNSSIQKFETSTIPSKNTGLITNPEEINNILNLRKTICLENVENVTIQKEAERKKINMVAEKDNVEKYYSEINMKLSALLFE
jgi:hypothetical protein